MADNGPLESIVHRVIAISIAILLASNCVKGRCRWRVVAVQTTQFIPDQRDPPRFDH
jgi:hypothetical protein